jgi:hypothetical protein
VQRLWMRDMQRDFPSAAKYLTEENPIEAIRNSGDEEALTDLAAMERLAKKVLPTLTAKATELTSKSLVPVAPPQDTAASKAATQAFVDAVLTHKGKLNAYELNVNIGTADKPTPLPVSVDLLAKVPKDFDLDGAMTQPVGRFRSLAAQFVNADGTPNPSAVADFVIWTQPELRAEALAAAVRQGIAQGRAEKFDAEKAGGEQQRAREEAPAGGAAKSYMDQVREASAQPGGGRRRATPN